MKKDTPAALATTETQKQYPVTKMPPTVISVAFNIENRHEVNDFSNVHYCRFFHGYVFCCADSSCPDADTCGAFHRGDD